MKGFCAEEREGEGVERSARFEEGVEDGSEASGGKGREGRNGWEVGSGHCPILEGVV